MPVFLLLFIVLPIAEMAVLIKVGSLIGVLNTVALVLLTAVMGAWLLRQQGLATLLRANERLNSGELPAREVAEGLILAVGGALLLTPGFITDAAGFLCLLPGTRHWLAARALKRLRVSGQTRAFYFRAGGGPFRSGGEGDIIEGEYREHTERDHDRLEKK
ncbi:FxsA family protein [Marinobacter lutaoensis]|uniref:Exlusion protein FxsA n=1 Tax=Marinobacter lutaoensis TaxID=135739 RepID=A0A1V2DXH2_9GAMM|nr:FxsA family protein [Marinobacter lutaoensis]MBE02737.1 exlusion protein FxsA [Marinobacter sp.]MBI43335.1 exlusion protein FxsA [Oceanospirillales bacterium]NVD34509.1 FxsA family protein [Marinobacter lutaoensis]ONF45475.1 exlusion protein FxsA [Marinobacter lutaoensis]